MKSKDSHYNNLIKIYGLGRFALIYNNQNVNLKNWTSNKAVKLLKYFILNRNKEIYKEELINYFWPEVNFSRGEKRVYNTIYLLRKNIGIKNIIVNNHATYRFNNNFPLWIDWEKFNELYNCCRQDASIEEIREAVELYRGDLFPGLRYEDWVDNIRNNLKEKHLDLIYKLSEKLYNNDQYLEALNYLNAGINGDPYREEYYNLAMKVLAKTCKVHEALSLYLKYKKLLEDDLGISPGINITQTYLKIKNFDFVEDNFKDQHQNNGALICSLEVFNNIFRLEKRKLNRNNGSFTIIEIDFSSTKFVGLNLKILSEKMAELFRACDVICCCNSTVKILLPDMNAEKTNHIFDRIFKFLKSVSIEGTPVFDFKEITAD